jgi:hypothetical protein
VKYEVFILYKIYKCIYIYLYVYVYVYV